MNNNYRIRLIVSGVVMSIALIFLLRDVSPYIVAGIVWLLWSVAYLRINASTAGRFSGALKALLDACDPQGYLEELRRVYEKTPERKRARISDFYRASQTTGYLAAGDWENARASIRAAESANDEYVRLIMRSNAILLHIYLGEIEKAQAGLEDLKQAIADAKLSKAQRQAMFTFAQSRYYEINIAKGNTAECEAQFQLALKGAKRPYARVNAQFKLGEVYRTEGRFDEAKEAYSAVVTDGNALYIARKAKEHLAEIEARHSA